MIAKLLSILLGSVIFPISVASSSSLHLDRLPSMKEVKCLASVIWHESRGEPISGQLAVAKVVLNRTKSEKFPKTICKVAFQKDQFTDLKRIKFDNKSLQLAKAALVKPISGFGNITFYHRSDISPYWSKHRDFTKAFKIGNHTFYKHSNS